MQNPGPSDLIDIHNHGSSSVNGVFIVENLMAHEDRVPENIDGLAYTYGIHPWFLNEANQSDLLEKVKKAITLKEIIALGEAGFDRIKGPSIELQRKVFAEQVKLAEENSKPVFIHCVRAWDELLMAHKQLKPKHPWLVHGFRGKADLAAQLISKGMYLSFWFDFIIKDESSDLIRVLPVEQIFLETDGSDLKIADIYNKVSNDLNMSVSQLKQVIRKNYFRFFNI